MLHSSNANPGRCGPNCRGMPAYVRLGVADKRCSHAVAARARLNGLRARLGVPVLSAPLVGSRVAPAEPRRRCLWRKRIEVGTTCRRNVWHTRLQCLHGDVHGGLGMFNPSPNQDWSFLGALTTTESAKQRRSDRSKRKERATQDFAVHQDVDLVPPWMMLTGSEVRDQLLSAKPNALASSQVERL